MIIPVGTRLMRFMHALLRANHIAFPAALAVALSSCGGIVVVDNACAGFDLGEGTSEFCYYPLKSGHVCAEANLGAVLTAMDHPGSFTTCTERCCTTETLTSVTCGPVERMDGGCCYYITFESHQVCQ